MVCNTLECVSKEARSLLALCKVAALDPLLILLHVEKRRFAHIKVDICKHIAVVGNIFDARNRIERDLHTEAAAVISNVPAELVSIGTVLTNKIIRAQLHAVPRSNGEGGGTKLCAFWLLLLLLCDGSIVEAVLALVVGTIAAGGAAACATAGTCRRCHHETRGIDCRHDRITQRSGANDEGIRYCQAHRLCTTKMVCLV